MEKSIRKLVVIGLLVMVFVCNALAAEPVSMKPDAVVSVRPPMAKNFRTTAKDFHINVETNKDVYHNKDVLRLAVQLLNNSPKSVYIGVCPIKPVPAEAEKAEVVDVFEGILDEVDVDVAIMPRRPIIIGYATLTRLGPSPVPYPVPYAEEFPIVKPKPIKFRLPLFGSARVPAHSTRIISTANVLIAHPLVAEAVEVEPIEVESAEVVDAEEEIEAIPAIARYITVKPGYYLLDCHIEKICGTKKAQAQKIIQIRRRILKPIPVPKPAPEAIK